MPVRSGRKGGSAVKFFPMFLRMAGRDVVIVGGGEQAAQKARLMLKTEARITVMAPALDDELAALVSEGKLTHHDGPITPRLFEGAALVFIGSGCPGHDAAIHALAREARALVNVVDQPELCEATTPSIVDRDPLVVAIGTEGAAPVLARQIKARMETLLEPRLGELVALSGRLREAAARRVPKPARRALWRWVFDGSPRALHARGAEREAAEQVKAAIADGRAPDDSGAGSLCVLQAAPSPDLMTLRAMQRLQEADAIWVGPGVGPELLELARRDAERLSLSATDGIAEVEALSAAVSEGARVVVLVREPRLMSAQVHAVVTEMIPPEA